MKKLMLLFSVMFMANPVFALDLTQHSIKQMMAEGDSTPFILCLSKHGEIQVWDENATFPEFSTQMFFGKEAKYTSKYSCEPAHSEISCDLEKGRKLVIDLRGATLSAATSEFQGRHYVMKGHLKMAPQSEREKITCVLQMM